MKKSIDDFNNVILSGLDLILNKENKEIKGRINDLIDDFKNMINMMRM